LSTLSSSSDIRTRAVSSSDDVIVSEELKSVTFDMNFDTLNAVDFVVDDKLNTVNPRLVKLEYKDTICKRLLSALEDTSLSVVFRMSTAADNELVRKTLRSVSVEHKFTRSCNSLVCD